MAIRVKLFCTECGVAFSSDGKFCSRCGAPRGGAEAEQEKKDGETPLTPGAPLAAFQPTHRPRFQPAISSSAFFEQFALKLGQESRYAGLDPDIDSNNMDALAWALADMLQHEIDNPQKVPRSLVFGIRDYYSGEEIMELDDVWTSFLERFGESPDDEGLNHFLFLALEYTHSFSFYSASKIWHSRGDDTAGLEYALLAISSAFSPTEVLGAALYGVALPLNRTWNSTVMVDQTARETVAAADAFHSRFQSWIALASAAIRWSFPRVMRLDPASWDHSPEDINIFYEINRSDIITGAEWIRWAHGLWSLNGRQDMFGHPGAVVEAIGQIWEFGNTQERHQAEETLRRIKEHWQSSPPAGADPPNSFRPARKYLDAV